MITLRSSNMVAKQDNIRKALLVNSQTGKYPHSTPSTTENLAGKPVGNMFKSVSTSDAKTRNHKRSWSEARHGRRFSCISFRMVWNSGVFLVGRVYNPQSTDSWILQRVGFTLSKVRTIDAEKMMFWFGSVSHLVVLTSHSYHSHIPFGSAIQGIFYQ